MLNLAFTVEREYSPRSVSRRPRAVLSVAQVAARMLDELNANCLEVVLVPDRHLPGADWRRLRCAESQNAAWYREFCGLYESNRRNRGFKFKTRIKRRETGRALRRLVDRGQGIGDSEKTPYIERLLEFINAVRADPEALRVYGLGG